jgi:hypothetical protein
MRKKVVFVALVILFAATACLSPVMVATNTPTNALVTPTNAATNALVIIPTATNAPPPTPQPLPTNEFPWDGTVCNSGGLHVRNGHDPIALVLYFLKDDDTVTVFSIVDGWGMIGQDQWVNIKYVCK